MAKYRNKPIVIEATQWFKNGDHPLDYAQPVVIYHRLDLNNHRLDTGITYTAEEQRLNKFEGQLVRYWLRPDVPGARKCEYCHHVMHDHGWIDTLEGGHIVCPGDWIITGVKGEFYPCKPDIFAKTYEEVTEVTEVQEVEEN